MSEFNEMLDTFFNGRPAPRTTEMERLRDENTQLRAVVRRAHGDGCLCWVCSPPKKEPRRE